jgi:hypothetical protein
MMPRTRIQHVGGEIHHRRGDHAEVDHVDARFAQAVGQRLRQFRAGQAAVAADDDLAFPLRQRGGAEGLADLPRDACVERAAEHAADVISLEDRFRERDHDYTLLDWAP